MAQPLLGERLYTLEEYLDYEEQSDFKNEYWYGRIYPMSSGTAEHSDIAANVVYEIRNSIGTRPIHVYNSVLKVAIRERGPYVYPDVTVVCGNPVFYDKKRRLLANPDVVFEVLSETTAEYDLGEKASSYRSVTSVKEIVLVAQDRAWVQVSTRQDGDAWRFVDTDQLEGTIHLESIDCTLQVADIYRLIEIKTAPALRVRERSDERA